MWFTVLLLAALLSVEAADTTPPVLKISRARGYLYHILLTVQSNEDGMVYCGALRNTGSGTYVPSVYQLTTGTGLDGYGTHSVTANTFTQVLVVNLLPSRVYDLYCYATDAVLNGISLTAIGNTRQAMVATASGGDYTPPTIAYVSPYQAIDSLEVTVYLQMSEDGVIYCVACQDHGSGTTAPTGNQIKHGNGVYDAWGKVDIIASNLYKGYIIFQGLAEDTAYDVYCFGVDMSGNGIDGSPAYAIDQTKIDATNRTVHTLAVFVATRFYLMTPAAGTVRYDVEPATWNQLLPSSWGQGCLERRTIESWRTPLEIAGAQVVNHASHATLGCEGLPAVPRLGGPFLALLRRGRCTFTQKALEAHAAGFAGLLVIDSIYGGLPDMTAPVDDTIVQVPAWITSSAIGDTIIAALSGTPPGFATADVAEVHRKPKLGERQKDEFGLRRYATM